MDERETTGIERKYYKSWQDRLDKGETFKDFSLFRPKILTMWNTSSYASGPGLEAGVDKDTLELSNDSISPPSTKTSHPRKLRKRVIFAIGLGIGAIIAALVPVILIFYLPKAEPSEVVSTVEVQATVQNMTYTEALANRDSTEYRSFTSQFCSEIEAVFQTSDLKDTYDGCLVTDLRNGSIIVIFQVVFIARVIPTEIQIKSSLLSPSKETSGTGQILVSLGVFLLEESTVIVGTVTIIEAADNPIPKIAYGDSCKVTSSCKTDWAECSGQRCTCPSSRYISHQSDSCLLLGNILGGKCSQSCSVNHAECDDGQESVCVCSHGYYNRDGACESKIAFQDPCVETGPTDQCATYGAGCNNNQCGCNQTHFHYQQNDTCLQLGSILGEACSGECDDPNSACEQDEGPRCICDGGYYDRDGTCEEKIAFEDPCVETGPADQCATYGAGCYNNKCSCNETHFHFQQDDTCLQPTKPETSPTTTIKTQATTSSSRRTSTTQMLSTTTSTESPTSLPSEMMSKTTQPASSVMTTTTTLSSPASSTAVTTSALSETQTTTLTTTITAQTPTLMMSTPTSSAATMTSTTTETIITVPSSTRLTTPTSSSVKITSALSTNTTKTTPASTLETRTSSTTKTMAISSTTSTTQTSTIKSDPSTSVTASNLQTTPPSTSSLTSTAKIELTTLLKPTVSIAVSTTTTMSKLTSSHKSPPVSSTTITTPTVTTPTVTTKLSSMSPPLTTTTTTIKTSTSPTIDKAATTPIGITTQTSSEVLQPSTTSTMTAAQTSPATATKPTLSTSATSTQMSTGELTSTALTSPATTMTILSTTTPNISHSLESTVSKAVSTPTTMSSPTSSHRIVTPTLHTTDRISTSSSKGTPSSLSSSTAHSTSSSITTKMASAELTTLTSSTKLLTTSSFTSVAASVSSTAQLISSTKALTSSTSTSTTTTMKASSSSAISKAATTPTGMTTQISSTVMSPSTTSTVRASQTSPTTATKPKLSTTATQTQMSTGEVTSTSPTFSSTTMTKAPTTTPNSPHSSTSGIPYIYFESQSHVAVIGQMASFVCFINNVPQTESITVTRGNMSEPVITVNANGDVEKHISYFNAVHESDTLGTHAIRISFTAQCGDAARYYCESSGMINATDIYVSGKPELTLSYEIVEGQEAWGDRTSLCEGELGSFQGSFIVEVLSSGSFDEYSGWWKLEEESTETDCGMYKKQKFVFYENTLEFMNNKQIRCAIKTAETFTEQELPVSEAKKIHVTQSNYCDDNTFEAYEHPYDCHYFVDCKTGQAGNIRFKYCGDTKCPNRTLAYCDVSSCDGLCNREFTTPTTSTTTTLPPGVPHIKCVLRSPLAKVGDTIHYICSLQYVDKVARIDIPELNFQEERNAGISGLLNIGTDVTLNVSMSNGYEVGISFENVKCHQEGDITIRINNETSDIISVRIIAKAEVPTLSMQENIYKNQDLTIICSGIVGRQEDGSPVAKLELQVKFRDANDFSAYTDERENTSVSSDSCTNVVTTEFTIYPNEEWTESKVRCVTVDDTNNLTYPSESVGPLSLLEPAIYFDAPSHVSVIGQMTSFTCFVNNVPNGESISVTRGNINEPVTTISTSGDVEIHISSFDVINDVEASGVHVIRINFTSQCGDAAKYFCESSGISTTTDIYVLSKPELTLAYEIVEGQEPWGDRPSLCEGDLGGIQGSFIVEVLSAGSFNEYTDWWVGDMDPTETECGTTYQKQKFYFYDNTLEFLNNKQIRCAIKAGEAFTGLELPVSEAKIIRVTPRNYCDNNNWEFYEHPYECNYYVNCNNWYAGNIHFQQCVAGFCPNRTACVASACDGLCNRKFTVPTTTIPTTRGIDPYIDCNNTVKGEVGSALTIYCMIGNTDDNYLTNITINKGQSLFLEASGDQGTQETKDQTATVTYTPTTISLAFLKLGCAQSTEYKFVVNNLLEDTVTVIANKDPMEPVFILPSFKRNQRATVTCKGHLGYPEGLRDIHFEKKMVGDTTFTEIMEGITDTVEFNESECASIKTLNFAFYATEEWIGCKIKCVTDTKTEVLYSKTETIPELENQVVIFNPDQPTREIGESLSINCTVSGVSGLTKISVSHGELSQPICSLTDAGVTSIMDNIECFGELQTHEGSIQIVFSSVQCSDEGEYICEPNIEASTPTSAFLTVTRAPTSPKMTSEPKSLAANKQMLHAESFVCEAEVGYPRAGSIILQNNRHNGIFEKLSAENSDSPPSVDNCRTNKTLTVKGLTFDSSWNNTQVRCAVEDDEGTVIETDSKEFTIQLVPEKYCEGQDEYSYYPYDCHLYIRCVGGNVHVNNCAAQLCPIFINGTLNHCNSDKCLELCP